MKSMLKGSVTESIVSSVGAEFLTQYFIFFYVQTYDGENRYVEYVDPYLKLECKFA